ncbi:MAG: lytic transglycosylase domain-containing protein [Rhizobiaceae bacterium]|nr:lytic transglycosylase domain-containing protein [Rhizobiaceae bacterium]MCV0405456.1 lytic transglycosylase domain-containing protein [Rhizobiaceae bacterium]
MNGGPPRFGAVPVREKPRRRHACARFGRLCRGSKRSGEGLLAARILILAATAGLALSACTTSDVLLPETALAPQTRPADDATPLDGLIAHYADHYDVPETLVRRVVKRESNFRPEARNGPYYGLMQILPQTARTMGHDGPPSDLLDAGTNLKYAVKYLRGAYMVADGDHDRAVRLYASGYYYDAKRKGMLVATGLKPGPEAGEPETAVAEATEPREPETAVAATSDPQEPQTTVAAAPETAPAPGMEPAFQPTAAFAGPTPTARPGEATPAFN